MRGNILSIFALFCLQLVFGSVLKYTGPVNEVIMINTEMHVPSEPVFIEISNHKYGAHYFRITPVEIPGLPHATGVYFNVDGEVYTEGQPIPIGRGDGKHLQIQVLTNNLGVNKRYYQIEVNDVGLWSSDVYVIVQMNVYNKEEFPIGKLIPFLSNVDEWVFVGRAGTPVHPSRQFTLKDMSLKGGEVALRFIDSYGNLDLEGVFEINNGTESINSVTIPQGGDVDIEISCVIQLPGMHRVQLIAIAEGAPHDFGWFSCIKDIGIDVPAAVFPKDDALAMAYFPFKSIILKNVLENGVFDKEGVQSVLINADSSSTSFNLEGDGLTFFHNFSPSEDVVEIEVQPMSMETLSVNCNRLVDGFYTTVLRVQRNGVLVNSVVVQCLNGRDGGEVVYEGGDYQMIHGNDAVTSEDVYKGSVFNLNTESVVVGFDFDRLQLWNENGLNFGSRRIGAVEGLSFNVGCPAGEENFSETLKIRVDDNELFTVTISCNYAEHACMSSASDLRVTTGFTGFENGVFALNLGSSAEHVKIYTPKNIYVRRGNEQLGDDDVNIIHSRDGIDFEVICPPLAPEGPSSISLLRNVNGRYYVADTVDTGCWFRSAEEAGTVSTSLRGSK